MLIRRTNTMIEENQNVDGTEEELLDNEPEDEPGTDEDESGEESEEQDSDDLSEDDDGDDSGEEGNSREARKARRDAQIDRLKEENRKLKESIKESGSEKSGLANNSELIERTYLSANGIVDKDVQNEVIRLANKFGMSVDEAMDDADIKLRADSLIKQKKAKQSVAKGTGGSAQKTRGVNWHTAYFEKNGDFAPGATQGMIAKVTDALAAK